MHVEVAERLIDDISVGGGAAPVYDALRRELRTLAHERASGATRVVALERQLADRDEATRDARHALEVVPSFCFNPTSRLES